MTPNLIAFIIVLYFSVLVLISFLTSRKSNNDSFFIGNRQSPWYVVAFGMIGTSLSGVTFISVPGWVGSQSMTYMQMVFGYFIGYIIISFVLLPLYYRLKLTSIYTYLGGRLGLSSYKTGAGFFLLSRTLGAAARLFLVAEVMHSTVFQFWGVSFATTVVITILFIWIYTFRGGIKTIIWTDTLQTLFMIVAVIVTIVYIMDSMQMDFGSMVTVIGNSDYGTVFQFEDWSKTNHFLKALLNGMLITIVMTGLDQDMMQKNLSCRSRSDAQKNMLSFSVVLIVVNFLFLALGALLFIYANHQNIAIPERTDMLYPVIATQGYLPSFVGIVFILGLIAAAYSSADSALTSLTTSFTVDIVGIKGKTEKEVKRLRFMSHVLFSVLLLIAVIILNSVNDTKNIIHILFTIASYTYGPLLGMFFFGIVTKRTIVYGNLVPAVAVLAPVFSFGFYFMCLFLWDYKIGYEILLFNGGLCFLGLWLISSNGEAENELDENIIDTDLDK